MNRGRNQQLGRLRRGFASTSSAALRSRSPRRVVDASETSSAGAILALLKAY